MSECSHTCGGGLRSRKVILDYFHKNNVDNVDIAHIILK